MPANWQQGNATEDGRQTRSWLVGHFIDPSQGVRSTKDVEVKWAHHPAGDQRADWTTDDRRTTLVILINGRFRVSLTEGTALLARQGDYVMWGPGIDHTWGTIDDSLVMIVRWPSRP